jgi:hypothetical protein
MKTKTSLLTTLAVLATTFSFTAQATPQVYDLKADWSDTQNPNGAWEYRAYEDNPGDLLSGTDPYYWDALLSADPFPWAREVIVDEEFGIIDVTALTRTTEAEAVPGVLEVGDIQAIARGWSSAGQVLVRWVAPTDGLIDIDGAIWEASTWDSAGWKLLVNGSTLSFGDSLGSSRSQPAVFSNGSGGLDALLNIQVQAGDRVDLRLSSWTGMTPFGVNCSITFTPDAMDPVAAIEGLALAVVEMNLQNGIENSLDSKLDAALNALEDVNVNNDGAACNSLAAFINAVEAQRGNKLTDAQASQLIGAAQEIQGVLNCGN